MRCLGRAVVMLLACLAVPSAAAASDSLCGTLADALTAEEAGLDREWIVQVPFDSTAWRLEKVTVGDGLVVALSGDGGVAAIAATPGATPVPAGTVLWSQRVGRSGGTVYDAAIGPSIVAMADATDVFGLDRQTGHLVWQEQLGSAVATGPGVSGDWIYAPLDINGVIRLAASPRKKPMPVKAATPPGGKKKKAKKTDVRAPESLEPKTIDAGGNVDMAPIPFGQGAAWCTTDGVIVAMYRDDAEWNRLEFDLHSPPAGPLLMHDGALIATTVKGDIARIERVAFGLRANWHLLLSEAVSGHAVLAGDTLVVPLAAGGAVGIAVKTGMLSWHSVAPAQLLAADASHLWCIDTTGRLALLDPADGTRLATFCVGPFTLPVVNMSSNRLVLASPKGVVVSLAPRGGSAVSDPDARAPASVDPAATPRKADRTTADPSE